MNIEQSVGFVTGAASGIGLGISRALLTGGARVMLADVERDALRAARRSLDQFGDAVETVHCDVTDRESVQSAARATLDAFGEVHIVCNNAGVSTGGFIDECDDGDWQWSIDVNYLGVVNGCRTFVPLLQRKDSRETHRNGHIVNTASMAGLLGGMPGWGPYNSTKFAVVGLSEVLRQEGRQRGYGVSVLCPGGVATNIFAASRNRDERYGAQHSVAGVGVNEADIASGLDPNIVGELVVEAIANNRMYIFTDPRFAKLLKKRHESMMSDLAWCAASDALVRHNAPGAVALGSE